MNGTPVIYQTEISSSRAPPESNTQTLNTPPESNAQTGEAPESSEPYTQTVNVANDYNSTAPPSNVKYVDVLMAPVAEVGEVHQVNIDNKFSCSVPFAIFIANIIILLCTLIVFPTIYFIAFIILIITTIGGLIVCMLCCTIQSSITSCVTFTYFQTWLKYKNSYKKWTNTFAKLNGVMFGIVLPFKIIDLIAYCICLLTSLFLLSLSILFSVLIAKNKDAILHALGLCKPLWNDLFKCNPL